MKAFSWRKHFANQHVYETKRIIYGKVDEIDGEWIGTVPVMHAKDTFESLHKAKMFVEKHVRKWAESNKVLG